ncbi:glycerophosphodiester phosphodiesterase [Konateibacter massiliensis]|uniref:glycerophosphodiester phosphodiesterase n=1 Tax=Konateibacter massiliensis TaxID=2002841 RepID=UPI000C14496F|nr:glycerophosphodiester phosphodiesterase [Konateibacter massiliensis]
MLFIVKNTWKIIKANFIELFVFLLCYHAASILIIYNFYSSSIDFALKKAGYSYITVENIIDFIGKPISIVLIVANALIILLMIGFEIICLLENYRAVNHNVKLKAYHIFLVGIFKTGKILKEGSILNFIPALFVLPFICLHFIVQEVANVKILNYLAQYIYESFRYKEVLYLILFAILAVSLLSAFIMPFVVLGEKDAKYAFTNSFKIVRKKAKKSFLYLIEWNVFLSAVVLVIYALAIVAAALLVSVFYKDDVALANLLIICDWIKLVTGILSNILGIAGNMAFIYSIYSLYRFDAFHDENKELYDYTALSSGTLKRVTLVISVVIVCVEGFYSYKMVEKSTTIAQEVLVTTQITAHRGGAAYAPENTMAALMAAIEVKSDYAEIDVQETKDGVVVLLHDSSLKRTTGYNRYIWDVTFDEVEMLDAGSKFGRKFSGEKVPALEEVIQYCKGKINLNIEIKSNGHNDNIVSNVLKVIEENEANDYCVITSMDYSLLSEVKEINPDIRTGYILKMAFGNFENKINADFLSIKHTYASKKVIAAAHDAGKEVHVWTVNSRSDIERMKLLDVDNIITDRPVTVREVYASEENGAGFIELLKIITR